MANANPERVYNALDPSEYSEIANYTASIRTSIANSQTSIQSVCMERDETGIPTAYNSTPNTAIMHSDTSISTSFKPSISQYSIEETITGELQDFSAELLTNNKFDTGDLTGWLTSGDTTVTDGIATLYKDPGITTFIQQNVLESGKTYLVSIDIIDGDGVFRVRVGGVNYDFDALAYIGKRFSGEYTAQTTDFRIYSVTDLKFVSVDTISVKELTTKTQRTEARLLTVEDDGL